MKLHTKLGIGLLSVIIFVIVVAQILLYLNTSSFISKLSEKNISLLKNREEGFARNIFRSIDRAVADSIERGEMEKFTKIINEQKKIKGLLEFSLYGRDGKVSHSTDQSYLGRELSSDHLTKMESAQKDEMILQWEKGGIVIYKPHAIE